MKNTKIAFELLSVSRELLGSYSREASFNWKDYGAWILPDGMILRVGYQEHMETAQEYFDKHKIEIDKNPYVEAFKRNWVRVIFKEMGIEMGSNLTTKQRYVLVDMIDENPYTSNVMFDSNGAPGSYFNTDDKEKAINKIRAAGLRKAKDWSFRDYGVWILPEGKILRVQKDYGHSDVAKDFFIKEDSSFSESPFLEASNRSWVRVALRPLVRVQIFGGLSSSQRSTLLDIVDQSTADEFFFEKGSINKVTNDKEDAERFLRNAHSRKASFRWRDYGAWILPDGGVLRVKDVFDHFEVAKDYMEKHGIEVESKVYDTAFSLGWVRAVFLPNLGVEMRNGISSSQRSTLLEMVEAYPGERFNFERRNRSTGIEDKEEAVDFLRAASVSR